jgi:hypothetical protein
LPKLPRTPLIAPLSLPPKYVSTKAGREALRLLHEQATPLWKAIDQAWRRDWFRHRIREYAEHYGHASAGVCTLLEQAAAAFADAAYIRGLGARDDDTDLMAKAHKIGLIAKGLEASALALCKEEKAARREMQALGHGGQPLARVLTEPGRGFTPTGDGVARRPPKEASGFGSLPESDPWPGETSEIDRSANDDQEDDGEP